LIDQAPPFDRIGFMAGFGVKQLTTAALSRSGGSAAMFLVKFGPS
jgi:hypothetical protein